MSKCQHVKKNKCQIVKMPKSSNVQKYQNILNVFCCLLMILQAIVFKGGMAKAELFGPRGMMAERWNLYTNIRQDWFTHMFILQVVGSREAAGFVEEGLMQHLKDKHHPRGNRNRETNDIGGKGPLSPEYTGNWGVYLVAAVVPYADLDQPSKRYKTGFNTFRPAP